MLAVLASPRDVRESIIPEPATKGKQAVWSFARSPAAAALFLRVALASGFLSAVADRFGIWGPAGTPGVVWGSFDPFLAYTGQLLGNLPTKLVAVTGWVATVLEVMLAVGLLIGIRLRFVAFASGLLLLVFAATMTIAFGLETPLSYSVWSAAAGAFLLASITPATELGSSGLDRTSG